MVSSTDHWLYLHSYNWSLYCVIEVAVPPIHS